MPDLLKLDYCRRLKGSLIGSNRQKHLIVERGILPRLISLLGNSESQSELQVAIAQTLGSVAKGMETHLKALIDCGVVPVLLNGLLRSNNKKLTEASLCCLKTIFVQAPRGFAPRSPVRKGLRPLRSGRCRPLA